MQTPQAPRKWLSIPTLYQELKDRLYGDVQDTEKKRFTFFRVPCRSALTTASARRLALRPPTIHTYYTDTDTGQEGGRRIPAGIEDSRGIALTPSGNSRNVTERA
ncbi:MAG: hypothetical protein CGU28_02170 [Candidatus Dactylopiibacterium carminicum]|uniref:Uncharacterized protein n=2 Tax=Candidatus Dactylopiibacterium carminicum TaxID=857335 RepID=A0A272EVE1_9RHOO|nr:hypothetical protein BGI27_04150 [Candidatus Dactylopiibacterium carminicum]PAS94078.1 MAG: hypothetical protein CGU29_05405 [Candidatus Dactylopiibacterium carminicum]PAS98159.1 MAG: hypothetical protein CGU28_02170 [Candidatus Dactylopiibacterium carminicum]PAT00094.1 MAG: hypothetical protein BSR46_04180 [Candidatus Dactylopiibacterium carminicum]